MLPMQELLRIRHLSLVLMRSWLRLWQAWLRNDLLIGQQKEKTFVQEANLTNAFYLLEHNLNAGDYHFFTEVWRSWEKQVSYRVYSTQTSHYSSILNKKGHGYGEMSKVEETLVSYLSPESSSSINPLTRTITPVWSVLAGPRSVRSHWCD